MSDLSWGEFEYLHQDLTTKFEQLCRVLFKRTFFDETAVFRSNPNHPGVEICPIYSPKTEQVISFQAKYFKGRVDYNQIKSSASKAIQHHRDSLKVFYFYCNKDLTSTSKGYKKIESELEKFGIKFEVISNVEILNQVLKYADLQEFFFKKHTITREWFAEYNQQAFDSLGARYDPNLNIETQAEEKMQLFTKNEKALHKINNKKDKLLLDLQNRDSELVSKAKEIIHSLDDINSQNVSSYFNWNQCFLKEIKDLKAKIGKLNGQLQHNKTLTSEKAKEVRKSINDAEFELSCLKSFSCSDEERQLLTNKILLVKGEAGMGKSQLFAITVKEIMDSGGYALLLLGHYYLSTDNISSQIINNFNFDGSFSDFLDAMDVLGECENKCIYIFIDAINETPEKRVWKNGLGNIFSEIAKRKHIKVVISIRTGYENMLMNDHLLQKIRNKEILKIVHHGFRESSIVAVKDFLNYYNIPFCPSNFLSYEMTNPLFLTLFCKTYTNGEMNVFQMFEKIIESVDKEIQELLGILGSGMVIGNLLLEIAFFQLNNDLNYITKDRLLELEFWHKYGIAEQKLAVISALVRSIILNESILNDKETYYFGYNLLEDYIKARAITKHASEKEKLKEFLVKKLLKIEDGKIKKHYNIDIFVFTCYFYFEKFSEDCVEIIKNIVDKKDQYVLANRYIKSFAWRPSSVKNLDLFKTIVNNYPIDINSALLVLIENSAKEDSSLNADFLHQFLFSKKLNTRDSFWLPFINKLTYDEKRVFQLVRLFNERGVFLDLSKRKTELLLVLFAWFLASSNRKLRDVTSKAMIEILKENFEFCERLLRKFENVNDPYVIQRLYGIIFGACVKRVKTCEDEYKTLVEFVYLSIFNKDFVYADILLRDYARLIIERFLFEFPTSKLAIDHSKVIPPYKSQDIPKVANEEYTDPKIEKDGLGWINYSMRPDNIGMYGDFGRYIFQSSLSEFEGIDIKNLYHYAMQYIRDELGYKNELFAHYDTSQGHPLNRARNHTIERIGKKYQWIVFYNIIARVSDKFKLATWGSDAVNYRGAWEPYVRDFDPTLNCHFMKPIECLPKFTISLNEHFLEDESIQSVQIKKWIKSHPNLFNSPISVIDDQNIEWVLLYQLKEVKYNKRSLKDMTKGEQRVRRIIQGYFVYGDKFDKFKENVKMKNFWGRSFPEGTSSLYQIFNREFAWSPSVDDILGDYWADCEAEVERVLPAYVHYLWEEGYDYSKEENVSFAIPCPTIVKDLKLKQGKYDGYFYSPSGDLVAFDGRITKTFSGLIIRKDYLEEFLKLNNLRMFWSCIGEKQYFKEQYYQEQEYSQWSGFYWMNETLEIEGHIRLVGDESAR